MEYSVVVNLPTEALIDVLLPPALPLLDKLRRFHNKGRTCRVITWGFRLYTVGQIPNRYKHGEEGSDHFFQNKSSVIHKMKEITLARE